MSITCKPPSPPPRPRSHAAVHVNPTRLPGEFQLAQGDRVAEIRPRGYPWVPVATQANPFRTAHPPLPSSGSTAVTLSDRYAVRRVQALRHPVPSDRPSPSVSASSVRAPANSTSSGGRQVRVDIDAGPKTRVDVRSAPRPPRGTPRIGARPAVTGSNEARWNRGSGGGSSRIRRQGAGRAASAGRQIPEGHGMEVVSHCG
jgi:hypothetical protein